MKKCIYCGKDIEERSVVDFCHECGVENFGQKTFKAILENMEKAREKGDLWQGSINLGSSDSEFLKE